LSNNFSKVIKNANKKAKKKREDVETRQLNSILWPIKMRKSGERKEKRI